ncbi:hypothetical protein [Joinjakaka virus]|uniref:Uncharacterized protein n=1 Tax=Joinjakaka virus TaxID=1272943 RepID=A0A0D3R1Z8_9RHAB|nr:hypothetical protein [Joinjakaka virus]AJR28537.1 hypothetical protein [Joinjakaka virus]
MAEYCYIHKAKVRVLKGNPFGHPDLFKILRNGGYSDGEKLCVLNSLETRAESIVQEYTKFFNLIHITRKRNEIIRTSDFELMVKIFTSTSLISPPPSLWSQTSRFVKSYFTNKNELCEELNIYPIGIDYESLINYIP